MAPTPSAFFSSHPRAKNWHPTLNGDLKPRELTLQSNKKFWFKCDKCPHPFDAALANIANGRWCPVCKNKTEKKLLEFLKTKEMSVEIQLKFDWCKNPETGRYLPFDFQVFGKIIIELDGAQHFKQVSNWQSPEDSQERDIYKMEQALNNDKHIIRILQEDVWDDKNDWENKLLEAIAKLKEISEPELICIGDNEVYKQYSIE